MGKFNHFNYYHYEYWTSFYLQHRRRRCPPHKRKRSAVQEKGSCAVRPQVESTARPSVGKIRRTFNEIVNWHRPLSRYRFMPSCVQFGEHLVGVQQPADQPSDQRSRVPPPLLVYIQWKIQTLFVDVAGPRVMMVRIGSRAGQLVGWLAGWMGNKTAMMMMMRKNNNMSQVGSSCGVCSLLNWTHSRARQVNSLL